MISRRGTSVKTASLHRRSNRLTRLRPALSALLFKNEKPRLALIVKLPAVRRKYLWRVLGETIHPVPLTVSDLRPDGRGLSDRRAVRPGDRLRRRAGGHFTLTPPHPTCYNQENRSGKPRAARRKGCPERR